MKIKIALISLLTAIFMMGCGPVDSIYLTETEANNETETTETAKSPVALYLFEDDLTDDTESTNDITTTGTVSYDTGANGTGRAVFLDNNNTLNTVYLTLPEDIVDNTYTVAFWAKVPSDPGFLAWGSLSYVHLYDSTDASEGFTSLSSNGSTFNLRFRDDVADVWGDTTSTLPTVDVWHHIAYTCDSNGLVTLYVDGEPVNTLATGWEDLTAASTTQYIGQDSWAAQECYIDNYAVYDEALSDTEITTVYGGTFDITY